MEGVKKRAIIQYDLKELKVIQIKTGILTQQIELQHFEGTNIIHPNQDDCGKMIKGVFENRTHVNCLVYGMTQTGKTGCMTALIQYYILSFNIPTDNIYVITGLSDKEWKKDTKNRMPDGINARVYHRSNLSKTFVRDIREKKNILVIMDEIQIACEENQTIHKTFEKCGFYDLNFLLENDIKLVQFSATPDGNINDMQDWGPYSVKIKLKHGDGYYGPKQALAQQRLRQYQDLTQPQNVSALKTDVEKYKTSRYHLIRVPNTRENKDGSNNQSIVISNIKTIFGEGCGYNTDYLKSKKGDINDLLKNMPNKHTFVFYCEILRVAKTQFKKYIGVSYERFSSSPNDSSITQGTWGRCTGYDDNGDSVCYTNISSLENYIKLWENNMVFKKGIVWNTKTTQYDIKDDFTRSTGTFNSVKHIEQLKDSCSEKVPQVPQVPRVPRVPRVKEDRGEPTINKFKTQDNAKEYYNKELKSKMKGRGPNKIEPNKDGYYEANIRGVKRVYSCEEIYKERKCNIMNGAGYGFRPCYENINDPSTVRWWFIHY